MTAADIQRQDTVNRRNGGFVAAGGLIRFAVFGIHARYDLIQRFTRRQSLGNRVQVVNGQGIGRVVGNTVNSFQHPDVTRDLRDHLLGEAFGAQRLGDFLDAEMLVAVGVGFGNDAFQVIDGRSDLRIVGTAAFAGFFSLLGSQAGIGPVGDRKEET